MRSVLGSFDAERFDALLNSINESRRFIRRAGVKKWRRMKRVSELKKAGGHFIRHTWKIKQAIRRGAAHNRHRY
jgi:hypothetical protein